MAKKSSIEKNTRRRKMAKSWSGRRSRLKAIVGDKTKPTGGALCRALKLAAIAAQRVGDPDTQPLRS